LRYVFADGDHTGARPEAALAALGTMTLEIVARSDAGRGANC
jgi:hypothetical protein